MSLGSQDVVVGRDLLKWLTEVNSQINWELKANGTTEDAGGKKLTTPLSTLSAFLFQAIQSRRITAIPTDIFNRISNDCELSSGIPTVLLGSELESADRNALVLGALTQLAYIRFLMDRTAIPPSLVTPTINQDITNQTRDETARGKETKSDSSVLNCASCDKAPASYLERYILSEDFTIVRHRKCFQCHRCHSPLRRGLYVTLSNHPTQSSAPAQFECLAHEHEDLLDKLLMKQKQTKSSEEERKTIEESTPTPTVTEASKIEGEEALDKNSSNAEKQTEKLAANIEDPKIEPTTDNEDIYKPEVPPPDHHHPVTTIRSPPPEHQLGMTTTGGTESIETGNEDIKNYEGGNEEHHDTLEDNPAVAGVKHPEDPTVAPPPLTAVEDPIPSDPPPPLTAATKKIDDGGPSDITTTKTAKNLVDEPPPKNPEAIILEPNEPITTTDSSSPSSDHRSKAAAGGDTTNYSGLYPRLLPPELKLQSAEEEDEDDEKTICADCPPPSSTSTSVHQKEASAEQPPKKQEPQQQQQEPVFINEPQQQLDAPIAPPRRKRRSGATSRNSSVEPSVAGGSPRLPMASPRSSSNKSKSPAPLAKPPKPPIAPKPTLYPISPKPSPQIKKDILDEYPDDMNPFGTDDEDDEGDDDQDENDASTVSGAKHDDSMNPFGSDSDDDDEDTISRTDTSVSSLNPFGPDSDSDIAAAVVPATRKAAPSSTTESPTVKIRGTLVPPRPAARLSLQPKPTGSPAPDSPVAMHKKRLSAMPELKPRRAAPPPPTNSAASSEQQTALAHKDKTGKPRRPPRPVNPKKKRHAPPPPIIAFKRQIHMESLGTKQDVEDELSKIDQEQGEIENTAQTAEPKLIDFLKSAADSCPQDGGDWLNSDLCSDWIALVRRKADLIKRETELIHLWRTHYLDEFHSDIEYHLRCLIEKPESVKTEKDTKLEAHLLSVLLDVIDRKNKLVEMQHPPAPLPSEDLDDDDNAGIKKNPASKSGQQSEEMTQEEKDKLKKKKLKNRLKKIKKKLEGHKEEKKAAKKKAGNKEQK